MQLYLTFKGKIFQKTDPTEKHVLSQQEKDIGRTFKDILWSLLFTLSRHLSAGNLVQNKRESSLHLLVQTQQWKHQTIWSKPTIMTSLTLFWCFYCWVWKEFTHCFGVFIIDFEHVNVGRGKILKQWTHLTQYFFLRCNCTKSYHCKICVTDFREGDLFAPLSLSCPETTHS